MGLKTERIPIRLVKTDVEALQPDPLKPYFNSVAGVQGLAVRVMPSGSRTWYLRYRHQGIQKILKLGNYPTMTPDGAKKAAIRAWDGLFDGTDPGEEKRSAAKTARQALTVTNLAQRYILEHIPGNSPKWGTEATRLIKKHVLPALGKLPIAKVGPADISALLFQMKQSTPIMANRVRAVMRTMFSKAEEWELRPLGTNPVSVVKQRSPEIKRERRLTDLELKTLGFVLRKSKDAAELKLAVRLALLAGMRKGEIQMLKWAWVNLDAGEIRIPPDSHKTGKKTGKARVVHLCSALVAQLKSAVPTLGCPYVVPAHPREDEDGKIHWPLISLHTPWVRTREAAGLSIKGMPDDEDPGLHDLRRTFASVGADLGLKGFVGELLGHAESTVTDIYTRSAAEPLHQAAEKIGARIEGILSGAIDPEKESEERRKAKTEKAQGVS